MTVRGTTPNGSVSHDTTVDLIVQPAVNEPPTASFAFSCSGLSCSFDAGGSRDPDGSITSYAWDFGDGGTGSGQSATTTHTYQQPGTYSIRLTVTDNAGAATTAGKEVAVTNSPPTAAYTVTCTGLRCVFDGGGSADSDGKIASYAWDFGDGTTAGGATATHGYTRAGNYLAKLTVTDNTGASTSAAKTVVAIVLTARAYRQGRLEKADLSWNAPSGTSIDIYRNGTRIARVRTTAYTDNINQKGSGSYTYKVCATAFGTCSDPVTVSFSAGATISRASRSARDVRVHRFHWHHGPIRTTYRGKKRS
jgi:PKD repeat protein